MRFEINGIKGRYGSVDNISIEINAEEIKLMDQDFIKLFENDKAMKHIMALLQRNNSFVTTK